MLATVAQSAANTTSAVSLRPAITAGSQCLASSHIWSSGYAAGYYAYLWSELIDDDAFYWFKENGGMTRANGQRFRDMVLSRGNSQEAAAMYRAFRGRDPIADPLLIERGLKPADTKAPAAPKK